MSSLPLPRLVPPSFVAAAALLFAAFASCASAMVPRDPDEHSHHRGAPLMQYNETLQLMTHSPTPPSYWSLDFGAASEAVNASGHPTFMIMHVFLMSVAFLGLLPMNIALRSTGSSWRGASAAAFWVALTLGLAAGGVYNKMTPDMYPGSTHSATGYAVILIALALSALDILAVFRRAALCVRSGERISLAAIWSKVLLGRTDDLNSKTPEYTHILSAEPDEDSIELQQAKVEKHNREAASWEDDHEAHPRQWPPSASSARTVFGRHSPSGSHHSEDTLHDFIHPSSLRSRSSTWTKIAAGLFATTERALLFAGFIATLSGISVYTGMCRGNYINGCLAHVIKGGIFWCYGLVTFARFLGAFSDLGWAWNLPPARQAVTAEFVESTVIFVYGVTNTWMERFGAAPGSPFTTKQVQHISIAVMFWFAGLVGMAIESKTFRNWLAATAASAARKGSNAVAEPHTYVASFNPFPALVIGVTGAAMSAHAQTYMFQVQIHALWGLLLCAFAVMRCFTYFFVWVSPPRSILPSRPPTEALASFFLACGGLMFVLSDEEITIAAMQAGHDDQMMFLNLAVAITCLALCWVLAVVGFKGWLKSRRHNVSFVSNN